MRRFTIVFTVLFIALSVTACSNEKKDEEIKEDIPIYEHSKLKLSKELMVYEEKGEFVESGKLHSDVIIYTDEVYKDEYLKIIGTGLDTYYVSNEELAKQDVEVLGSAELPEINSNLQELQQVSLKEGTTIKTNTGLDFFTTKKGIEVSIVEIGLEAIKFRFNDAEYSASKEDSATELISIDNSNQYVPVMMYHFFYSAANGEVGNDSNWLEVEEFREQLQYLRDEGYATLTMKELYSFLNNEAKVPEKSIVISIDDGAESVYKYAYPLLKEFDMNATLFLITGWMGESMPPQFKEMEESGLELQSHSNLMHDGGCSEQHGGRLLCVPEAEGVEDIKQSMSFIGNDAFVFCYPFGDVNEHAINILQQAGMGMAFTTQYGQVTVGMDLFQLPRVRVSGGAGIARFIGSIQ